MVAKKETTGSVKPVGKTIKIETANDVYELARPAGKVGGLHFRLITKAAPKTRPEEYGGGDTGVSPADQERLEECFGQWVEQVLPAILISHSYDDVPGEDQWLLFLAMFQSMNVSGDLFRIIA